MEYLEMVANAMKSQKDAEPWFAWLRQTKARKDAEHELITSGRKKHPGLANYEILGIYAEWLDKHYPLPVID